MSDKLQFVVAFGSGRMAETSDKLQPESTDKEVMKGKDRLGDGSANCHLNLAQIELQIVADKLG